MSEIPTPTHSSPSSSLQRLVQHAQRFQAAGGSAHWRAHVAALRQRRQESVSELAAAGCASATSPVHLHLKDVSWIGLGLLVTTALPFRGAASIPTVRVSVAAPTMPLSGTGVPVASDPAKAVCTDPGDSPTPASKQEEESCHEGADPEAGPTPEVARKAPVNRKPTPKAPKPSKAARKSEPKRRSTRLRNRQDTDIEVDERSLAYAVPQQLLRLQLCCSYSVWRCAVTSWPRSCPRAFNHAGCPLPLLLLTN